MTTITMHLGRSICHSSFSLLFIILITLQQRTCCTLSEIWKRAWTIGHRKEFHSRRQSEWQRANTSLWRRVNARNVSFERLSCGKFTLSTQLIILNYPILKMDYMYCRLILAKSSWTSRCSNLLCFTTGQEIYVKWENIAKFVILYDILERRVTRRIYVTVRRVNLIHLWNGLSLREYQAMQMEELAMSGRPLKAWWQPQLCKICCVIPLFTKACHIKKVTSISFSLNQIIGSHIPVDFKIVWP